MRASRSRCQWEGQAPPGKQRQFHTRFPTVSRHGCKFSPPNEIEVPYLPLRPSFTSLGIEGSQKPITPIIPCVFQCILSASVIASGTSVTSPGIDGNRVERQT
jgi:hypothetical protein